MLNDFHLPPLAGGSAQQAVIFLHGLGDSGSGGLLSVGELWQPHLPHCEFLCPDAPFVYDMAPGDSGGRQWFSLQSFASNDILAGVKVAEPLLNAYIDHILETRGLTPEKLALVGFSQGTMMALYTAPRRAQPVAGIVGYSGLLVAPESLITEKKSSPPVLLVHGQADEVVPFIAMGESERGLKAAGLSVRSLARPGLGHGLDDAGIATGVAFLMQYFATAKTP
jgi:phospholipase/carboxylesterase